MSSTSMSGPPPDWDQAPPPDPDNYGRGGGGQGRGGNGNKRPARPKMTPEQINHAAQAFYAWLTAPDTLTQLKLMLPDHIGAEVFIATCKTTVLNKPDLLEERYRPSLMVAIMKAAGQGLKPDGKEGALVARWDSEGGGYAVTWQPMVWGICKLGRETGAIKSIRANIVFVGEAFRVIQGEEDRIEHEVSPEIVEEAYASLNDGLDPFGNPKADADAFFERVRAAYCFITGMDGTVTKRWMTKNRLISLREASKAKAGPWASRWVDEMILKGMILFTGKWINLDTDSIQAKRFHAALLTDLEVDFDRQGEIAAPERQQPALPAPSTKLDTLEALFRLKEREPVPVDAVGDAPPPPPSQTQTQTATMERPKEVGEPAPKAAEDTGKPADKADEPDSLMDATAELIGKIGSWSEQEVSKATGSDKYRKFIKKLSDAGRHDLIKQLADRIREKLA
jgi:recombinational DNA repair protein RecT